MVQPIRWLSEVCAKGGTIKAECRGCGRIALFDPRELEEFYRRKGWDRRWPQFALKLRCKAEGCGANFPVVTWSPDSPPPDTDPLPPTPRFTRAARPRAQIAGGAEWEKARERRRRSVR